MTDLSFYKAPSVVSGNHLIVGAAGTGKTTKFVYGTILEEMKEGRTFIVFGRKIEAPKTLLETLKEEGYKIYELESLTVSGKLIQNEKVIVFCDYIDTSENSEVCLSRLRSLIGECDTGKLPSYRVPVTVFIDELNKFGNWEKVERYLSNANQNKNIRYVVTTQNLDWYRQVKTADNGISYVDFTAIEKLVRDCEKVSAFQTFYPTKEMLYELGRTEENIERL